MRHASVLVFINIVIISSTTEYTQCNTKAICYSSMNPLRMQHSVGIGEKVKDAGLRLSWKVYGHGRLYSWSSNDNKYVKVE